MMPSIAETSRANENAATRFLTFAYDEEAAVAGAVDFAVDAIDGFGVLRPQPRRAWDLGLAQSPEWGHLWRRVPWTLPGSPSQRVEPPGKERRGQLPPQPLPEVVGATRWMELPVSWAATRTRGGVLDLVEIALGALQSIGELRHGMPLEPGGPPERVW
jgi:hypothetical protein